MDKIKFKQYLTIISNRRSQRENPNPKKLIAPMEINEISNLTLAKPKEGKHTHLHNQNTPKTNSMSTTISNKIAESTIFDP